MRLWFPGFVTSSTSTRRRKRSPRGSGCAASRSRRSNRFGDGDAVIDFEVTANRPDCLSVLGLAREVATLYDLPLTLPSVDARREDPAEGRCRPARPITSTVTIEDAELCPRYAAAVADVTVGASPAWMTRRLQAAGIRPISSIVDLTNYVLIELGHPMHAFDLAKLAGAGDPRPAREAGRDDDDARRRRAQARPRHARHRRSRSRAGDRRRHGRRRLRGLVRHAPRRRSRARTSSRRRSAGRASGSSLKTEASSRFERGADIDAPVVALQRLAALMEQIGAGRTVRPDHRRVPRAAAGRRASPAPLAARGAARRRGSRPGRRADPARLGLAVTATRRRLGRRRSDVPRRSAARSRSHRGSRPPLRLRQAAGDLSGRHRAGAAARPAHPARSARAPGPDGGRLSEAVTFGFIEAKAAEAFAPRRQPAAVALANPLSAKFDTLRPSLLPGLVDAVAHNRRHGRDDVRLFEIGTRFAAAGETRAVARRLDRIGGAAPLVRRRRARSTSSTSRASSSRSATRSACRSGSSRPASRSWFPDRPPRSCAPAVRPTARRSASPASSRPASPTRAGCRARIACSSPS